MASKPSEIVVTLSTTRNEVLDRFVIIRSGPLVDTAKRARDVFADWAASRPDHDRIFIEE